MRNENVLLPPPCSTLSTTFLLVFSPALLELKMLFNSACCCCYFSCLLYQMLHNKLCECLPVCVCVCVHKCWLVYLFVKLFAKYIIKSSISWQHLKCIWQRFEWITYVCSAFLPLSFPRPIQAENLSAVSTQLNRRVISISLTHSPSLLPLFNSLYTRTQVMWAEIKRNSNPAVA